MCIQLHATTTQLTYIGTHHQSPITLNYVIQENESTATISAIINAPDIQEDHISIIKKPQNTLQSLTQTTTNKIDNKYFNWTVKNNENLLTTSYHDTLTKKHHHSSTTFVNMPLSLQALLYKLQTTDLFPGKVIRTNLLVPWNSVYPIRLIVSEPETLTIRSTPIETYKIIFEIDLFFGGILPKSTIWVTKHTPHYLIKQIGFNKSYQLDFFMISDK